jgi:hypothetical protein
MPQITRLAVTHFTPNRLVHVPHWIAAATFALLPVIWLFVRLTARQRNSGNPNCPTCGYNLTGNLSGTCPECGTPLPKV